MTMLFYTDHGTSPSVRQAKEWLPNAGLVAPRMTVLETHQILVAQKP